MVEDVPKPVVEEVKEEPAEEVIEAPIVEEVKEEPVVEAPVVEEPKKEVKEEKTPAKKEKPAKKEEKIEVSPEVQIAVEIDWNAAVGKFFVSKRQLSIYRAPNSYASGKPFLGRIQVVQNTNDIFVKVRYVRSGLGATYGYAKKSQIIQTCC